MIYQQRNCFISTDSIRELNFFRRKLDLKQYMTLKEFGKFITLKKIVEKLQQKILIRFFMSELLIKVK